MSNSKLITRHSYAKVILDRVTKGTTRFEADLMAPEGKTNGAICFGDQAFGGPAGLCLVFSSQNLSGRSAPFINFGSAQFLGRSTLERV